MTFVRLRLHPVSKAAFGITVLLAALVVYVPRAHADTTWNVTPSSACTLADAITANTTSATTGSCAAGTGGTGTINLAAGTYTLNADLPNVNTVPLTIIGAGVGSTIIDGQNLYNVFYSGSGDPLNISNLTIVHAGGFSTMAITAFSSTIQNVVIRDSTAVGGIDTGGTTTISNVAIVNTKALGYGVHMSTGTSTITITNVTISGNGQGLFVVGTGSGTVNITNATIANNNNAGGNPAGITLEVFSGSPVINLKNTILANNLSNGTPSNCGTGTLGGHPMILPTSQGHVISSDNTCGFVGTSNHSNTDPALGSLTASNNTYVLPIDYNSPAYDSGDSTGAPSTDQRGIARPQCTGVDIGAYETATCAPAPPSGGGGTTGGTSGSSSGATKTTKTTTAATPTTAPPDATATATSTPTTTIPASDTTNSTTDKVTPAATSTKKTSSHVGTIWVVAVIIVVAAGATGWFWLAKHPKLLKKLLHK